MVAVAVTLPIVPAASVIIALQAVSTAAMVAMEVAALARIAALANHQTKIKLKNGGNENEKVFVSHTDCHLSFSADVV